MSIRQKLGSKQAYCVIHQPVSVVVQCWLKGLACGDQRRLTGSGSTLEAYLRRDDARYKSTVYLLTSLADLNQQPQFRQED